MFIVILCMCDGMCHALSYTPEGQRITVDLVLSFHLCACSTDQIHVLSHMQQALYLLSHFNGHSTSYLLFFLSLSFFETRPLYIALAVLELSVDQTGLTLRGPPASAFRVLGLKACTTTAQHKHYIF